jgi:predicted nucleic acid-binding protein
MALTFVDANVFLYAHDQREPLKQSIAQYWVDLLWEKGTVRTSTQALNEFYVNATRKLKPALSQEAAWSYVARLLRWKPQPINSDILLLAQKVEQRYRLNWWDCLIVAAAQEQKCTILLTEDLQDRAIYGGIRVQNPFTSSVSEPLAEYAVRRVASETDARWKRWSARAA